MKCSHIVFAVLLPLMTAALPAQVTETAGKARLDRAILIEEQEHDLREAERLYREVALDESLADRGRSIFTTTRNIST